MNILRLAIDADLSEESLRAAVDVMHGAGEDLPLLHLMVGQHMVDVSQRLLAAIALTEPKSLLGMLARSGRVDMNYLWPKESSRWLLLGANNIVASGMS